ncbi:transporter [Acidihalobacter yilgarnensis]|uniref:Transporter n=1 Tax=Acidihalobacter yilgarnensis TaxID=2819280 RepID=A0A1D8IKW4_9GAMM|nr:AEC family transporter [Acidihalobacter yilgarnensis]AOU97104.1 transporter [Acidihalobacter yilgarnensis]
MTSVLGSVLPVFALILAGFITGRRGLLGAAATDSLNNFVVWLALPALLFQAMAQITWQEVDHPGFLIAFGGGVTVTFVVALLLGRSPGRRLADLSLEGLSAAYANTGYMGIPLCLILFGKDSLPPAIIATLITATVLFGAAIVLIETDLQQNPNLGRTLRQVGRSLLRNPLLLSPLLGLIYALTGLPLPEPVLRFTSLLGAAASPCALVTIGLFLSRRQPGRNRGSVWRIVGLKLVLQPLVTGLLALWVFDMPAVWSHTALLMSALPVGTGPFMLAKFYDREAGIASHAILYSTLISVLTISGLAAWLGTG